MAKAGDFMTQAISPILKKILAVKAQEVAAALSAKPLPKLRLEAEQAGPVRDFVAALPVRTIISVEAPLAGQADPADPQALAVAMMAAGRRVSE